MASYASSFWYISASRAGNLAATSVVSRAIGTTRILALARQCGLYSKPRTRSLLQYCSLRPKGTELTVSFDVVEASIPAVADKMS